jgi:hypothetical protein
MKKTVKNKRNNCPNIWKSRKYFVSLLGKGKHKEAGAQHPESLPEHNETNTK